jgi:hypothetical protein
MRTLASVHARALAAHNGWFALFSGLSACPLINWVLKKYRGNGVSGWLQFAVAFFFWFAGNVAALTIWPPNW